MLSEKGFKIERAINSEWAKSHIYCPLNYARIAAQAVLALERPAEPEPPAKICGCGYPPHIGRCQPMPPADKAGA
jgi:hypothetical protein